MKYLSILFVFVCTFAMAQNKKVTASTINWWGYKVAKTAASSHTGTINLKSGNLVLKDNKLVGGSFVMDMNSITSTDLSGESLKNFNSHLKTGDFFETEKFPLANYVITSVGKSTNANYPFLINGNLTLKGITKKVSFPAKLNIGTIITLVSDKFSYNRQDFNVEYQSTMKDVVINNDIDMKISLTAK